MSKSPSLGILERVTLLVVTRFGAGIFSRQELLNAWINEYPNSPTSSVLPADYCVNTKTGRHTPLEHRFLFTVEEGIFRIYDPSRDGTWEIDEDGARQVL